MPLRFPEPIRQRIHPGWIQGDVAEADGRGAGEKSDSAPIHVSRPPHLLRDPAQGGTRRTSLPARQPGDDRTNLRQKQDRQTESTLKMSERKLDVGFHLPKRVEARPRKGGGFTFRYHKPSGEKI